MARLKVIRTDGSETVHTITPAIEVAFETYAKMGLHKAFQELGLQSHIYWIAWECLRRSGETVKPFTSPDFLDSLVKVEVLDDDPLD